MINMKYTIRFWIAVVFILGWTVVRTQDTLFVVKGFAIGAPKPAEVDRFIKFIDDELGPRKVNTLILRVDYNFQYKSHPELRDSIALSAGDVDRMVVVCQKHTIRIIPQINLLGHQSWANKTGKLLEVYPQFDETPHVLMPEKYKWPNPDGLYCKSYCPLHPDVHGIVFDLVDELCDQFKADAFHAGMDEVFYIGDEKCPRCRGIDKAELFAGEITTIRNHLKLKNRELWIWGDRLIDGRSTGIGLWEASLNYTHRAIDMMPKDVVICDWHYERPDQTPVYFAMKGYRVVTCPWNRSKVALSQAEDIAKWRKTATKEMKPRYYGMVQTVWSGPSQFIDGFYGIKSNSTNPINNPTNPNVTSAWETFKVLYSKMDELETGKK